MGFNGGGLALVVVMMAAAVGNAAAATYVVGDNLGWKVPDNPADYANWASNLSFAVGDVLVFNFMTGIHDVAQVTKASYDSCSSNNPLLLVTLGPANITLNSTGPAYFICTFGSHCSLGQKLAINVSSTTPTPLPAPVPAPSAPPTPAPTPAPTPTPTLAPTPTPFGSPSPAPTPGSAPAPAPTPTPSGSPPPSGPAPGSSATPGAEGLTPPAPPPPSSATISTASASLLGFAFVAVGLMVV